MTIVGVTSEPKQPTEDYVRDTGMKHAYAYDPDGKLSKYFGVSGIPHSVLIDAGGTVVWSGHPAGLNDTIVESALAGALSKPVFTWPAETEQVRLLLSKREFAAALTEAKKLDGPYAKEIQSLVSARRDAVRKALEAGDYLRASEAAAVSANDFAGLPEGDEIQEALQKLRSDPQAQRVIEGQRKLSVVLAEVETVRLVVDAKRLLEELGSLRDGYSGTIVATRATTEYEALEARLP